MAWNQRLLPILLSLLFGIIFFSFNSSSAQTILPNTEKLIPDNTGVSLLGPDVDGNGVRDDIDLYIEGLTDTPLQKNALKQASEAIAQAVQAGANGTPSELTSASATLARAVHCIWDQYDDALANNKVEEIEKLTVNTRARRDAYEHYNAKRSGTSSRLPQGDTCDAH